MSEEVKQEGEFKVKKPSKPKNLGKTEEVTKVEIPNTAAEAQGEVIPEVTKVEIKEQDAIQTQETNDSDVIVERSEDSSNSQEVVEEVRKTEEEVETPLTLVDETEVNEPVEVSKEPIQQAEPTKQLPENIEKLVSFMEETGGTVADYVRLNADYSNVDSNTLVREYYKQTRPHLDHDDVSLLLEDFIYDEELDDEKEIRKKKIAFKEEVGKAKNFLEDLKGKYYDEIKLRPGVTQDQQKATDFFNRYNEQQIVAEQQHEEFKSQTKKLFNQDFKGFDFNLGERKFRYGVKDPSKVAENQSNINNLVGKFLNEDGSVKDPVGYHKAMYAASNVDTIANHFYEQGKADAVKEVISNSKNPSSAPRQTPQGEFKNGIKVKVLNNDALSASKLKIKKIKI